ncbi:hypothetical protein ACOSP7_031041 [Xanthoceras sorbifolium]
MIRTSTFLFIFHFVLVCNVAISLVEARKLSSLEKIRETPSLKSSFIISAFIKDLTVTPPAPSDEEGYAMPSNNERLFSIDVAGTTHRILEESVPSPGIGH